MESDALNHAPDAPKTFLPLSVFVIACNEADRIGAALSAVRNLTDDIILVDSGSTDGTQDAARQHGARVVFNPWPGYGPQKRFAEDLCRYDWVLNVDADEVIPPDLAAEIRALFMREGPRRDAYRIRIAEMSPNEEHPHPLAHALAPVRLYRRSVGRYASSTVHDRVQLPPGTEAPRLRGIIHHRSARSLSHQIVKLNAYSDMQADDMDRRRKTIPALRMLTEFPLAFLKAYILRRHFIRGLNGYVSAINYAFSRHLRLAKHLERRRRTKNSSPTHRESRLPREKADT